MAIGDGHASLGCRFLHRTARIRGGFPNRRRDGGRRIPRFPPSSSLVPRVPAIFLPRSATVRLPRSRGIASARLSPGRGCTLQRRREVSRKKIKRALLHVHAARFVQSRRARIRWIDRSSSHRWGQSKIASKTSFLSHLKALFFVNFFRRRMLRSLDVRCRPLVAGPISRRRLAFQHPRSSVHVSK